MFGFFLRSSPRRAICDSTPWGVLPRRRMAAWIGWRTWGGTRIWRSWRRRSCMVESEGSAMVVLSVYFILFIGLDERWIEFVMLERYICRLGR
ncbi:hypothetical protein CONLIGDRAFT_149256 [Coniochaeta ligniaria NRRL 30616]|uniref:Uncharacterized protein n=1 Tax=Coniochaeta ligniaria NRRL 30616 TaxID=1408157 RepID=A0A1J7INT0_9PEZI|nr:hypothetical protein CONLIGDRAFT_149256 [Coniochaeta ligniaria NRRL 30616]